MKTMLISFCLDVLQEDIFQMFREMFQAATALPSPQGISNCPQARAMYAIDLLLEWRKNSKGSLLFTYFFKVE